MDDNLTRRISVAILAMGGQGGGVLADWIADLAGHAGWHAQTTSVPGVAQRTGATVYYVEIYPPGPDRMAAREPVLALMPVPGDVDVVVGAELMEAGRAIQRGLVAPERTTLIASTHRAYSVQEKSALGNGIGDPQTVHEAAAAVSRRYIAFDMAAMAADLGSVISAVLFGAIAGCGALSFPRAAFEAAIRRGGVGVEASLRAFAAGFERAAQDAPTRLPAAAALPPLPPAAAHPQVNALLRRIRGHFPEPARHHLVEGARRLIDYMDVAYAAEYLDRLAEIATLDERCDGATTFRMTVAVARYLALWMSYEDTIRVADLKTRGARFERFRDEVRAQPSQIVDVTEFMHPRLEEIADTLPAALGRRLLDCPALRNRLAGRLARGRLIRTTTLRGFLVLYALGRLRGYRRRTLRHQRETAAIAEWLALIARTAPVDHALACEIAECPRLIKGYGETHARGMQRFGALIAAATRLTGRADAAPSLRRLREAALADEHGDALNKLLAKLAPAQDQGRF